MDLTVAWRTESFSREITLESCNPDSEKDRVAAGIAWGILFERQVCLEMVRDSEPGSEERGLQARFGGSAEPNGTPFGDQAYLANRVQSWMSLDSKPERLETIVLEALRGETSACIADLQALGRDGFIDKTVFMVRPDLLFCDRYGHQIASDTATSHWGLWYPGLENDEQELSAVIDRLPGAEPVDIPEVIRKLENPASPEALAGAVTLPRHDVIHILLGRGLLDQDEAFVIGFTMGNSSKYRDSHGNRMREALSQLYPEPYRISGKKLLVFDLGVYAGKTIGIHDLADIPIEDIGPVKLGQVRADLRINTDFLRDSYRREKAILPDTIESGRLPV